MISHVSNPTRLQEHVESGAAPCVDNLASWEEAVREVQSWPEYQSQPLRHLPGLAKRLGIAALYCKDESRRFGLELASYKALGAPYAVFKLLYNEVESRLGVQPTSFELRSGRYRQIAQQMTVCVSTDGNHGRALAYGAQIFGCRCLVYIHREVSAARAQKMKDLGAIVIRIDGDHKDSVDRARKDAAMNDWHFVSSTSLDDFKETIPRFVMAPYTLVCQEALDSIEDVSKITHVLVCGGVGSISARIFLSFYLDVKILACRTGVKMNLPRFIVVEPLEADCLMQSAKVGSPQLSEGSLTTLMAGLACRFPSPAAWKLHMWLTSDFVAVPDAVAVEGMRAFADAEEGDVPIVCGESSAATLGVLIRASGDADLREKLGLGPSSEVVIFGLEGATDPEMYQKLTGKSREVVMRAQDSYVAGAQRNHVSQ